MNSSLNASLAGNNRVKTVHGWGSDARFWDSLKHEAKAENWQDIDAGYMKSEILPDPAQTEILITHSLGLTWAMHHGYVPSKALIVINSFTAFRAFTPRKTLNAMEANLKRNPKAQMKIFWSMAGMTPPQNPDFNVPLLKEGLEWLKNKDIAQDIASLSCPILVLAGAKDRICPIDALEKQWQGRTMITHPEAGHALPQTHPDWCAQQIKDWLKEMKI